VCTFSRRSLQNNDNDNDNCSSRYAGIEPCVMESRPVVMVETWAGAVAQDKGGFQGRKILGPGQFTPFLVE
jgi:hypothetical protein